MKNHCAICAVVCCMCILIASCSMQNHRDHTAGSSDNTAGKNISVTYSAYANTFEAEYKIEHGVLFGRGKNSLGLFDENVSDTFEEWTQITDAKDIIHVEAVNGTIIFLTETGCVYAFGNSEGLFNENNSSAGLSIISSPQLIMEDCVHASLGIKFLILLKSDNTLWFLGESKNGQSTLVKNGFTIPIQIAQNVLAIKAFGYTSAWIDGSYSLYMCGDNSYGQIGNGNQGSGFPTLYEDIVSDPYLVLNNCIEISTIDEKSIVAKTKDGSIYAWGGKYGTIPKQIK